jgi:hypothetical protein
MYLLFFNLHARLGAPLAERLNLANVLLAWTGMKTWSNITTFQERKKGPWMTALDMFGPILSPVAQKLQLVDE